MPAGKYKQCLFFNHSEIYTSEFQDFYKNVFLWLIFIMQVSIIFFPINKAQELFKIPKALLGQMHGGNFK